VTILPLTAHAARRMAERNITAPMVAAVLRCGDVVPGTEDGTISHRLCGLRVVTSVEHGVIITVCAERSCPAEPGPKRRARLAGQLRRKYSREARLYNGMNW